MGNVFFVLTCVLALTACGGGGDSPTPGLTVTADRSSLRFVGFTPMTTHSQAINFTLVNAPSSGEYYGQVLPDQPGDFQATFTATSATTAVVAVNLLRTDPMARSGTMTFRLCNDVNCNKVAWTQSMPYTVNIYSIAMDGVTLSGYEGVAGQPVNVPVTPADTANQLSVTASMTSGTGWLNATHATSANIAVGTTGVNVSKGSYQGLVRIAFAGQADGPTMQIPVSFTVGEGIVAPPAATTDLMFKTTSASTATSADIGFRGAQAPAWTANSDQPWLVLNRASGAGPGALTYAIDSSKVDAIANWDSATANVKISAAGLSDVNFPVTLNKRLPEVYVTAPGVVRTGAASTVHISGRGLSQLTDVTQIQVGNLSGIAGSIISDTSATLTLPGLPPGRTTVAIANALGIATTSTTIGAANISELAAAAVATTGDKRSSLFDPTRNAVFTVNSTQDALVRFTLSNGQWQAAGMPTANIGDMAMSPDRRTLYVSSGSGTLLAVEPDTLRIRTTYSAPAGSPFKNLGRTRGLAVTSNLRMWFGADQWSSMRYFDMLSSSFGVLQAAGSLYSPSFYAAGNGSTMLVSQQTLSPPLPNYIYAPATNSLVMVPHPTPVTVHAIYNEDGSRVLVDNTTLYSAPDFTLIGSTPGTYGIGSTAVLSPDGRRVYRLITANPDSLVVDHIDVYDATQVNPASSELIKLGEIAVSGQAASCGSNPDCDVVGSFIISPLGDTLFWLGNQQFVVIPIPSALASLQSAGPRLRPAATR